MMGSADLTALAGMMAALVLCLELVLFPNAGYFPGLMPARAADNGVWVAVSSANCPAGAGLARRSWAD